MMSAIQQQHSPAASTHPRKQRQMLIRMSAPHPFLMPTGAGGTKTGRLRRSEGSSA